MANARILQYPDPHLRAIAAEVTDFDASVAELGATLAETMAKHGGIGLAAPQIGVLRRVITIAFENGPLILVNPVVKKASKKTESGEEGCLSIKEVFGMVDRAVDVTVEAQTVEGQTVRHDLHGLAARIAQHEIDHLNGVLFTDKWTAATSGGPRARSLGFTVP